MFVSILKILIKNFCLLHLIFQNHISWSSFVVHMYYKRIISPGIFFVFFFFSKLWLWGSLGGIGVGKRGKMAQNDKKFCLSHSVFQERYIIWLWFLVHMSNSDISSNFFLFSKVWFLGFLVGWKGKKWSKITNFGMFCSISQESYWDFDNDIYRCFSLFFFKKCNIVNIKIIIFLWVYYLLMGLFVIIICFSSSSINVQNKFWVVPHLLHMCVIFLITDTFITAGNHPQYLQDDDL